MMAFFGLFGSSAKSRVKEASSDATQIERLCNDSRHAARELEEHLQHILHTMPSDLDGEQFRKLQVHLEVLKRHAEDQRQHLRNLDEHARHVEEQLQRYGHHQQAQHVEHQKAA